MVELSAGEGYHLGVETVERGLREWGRDERVG